MGVEEPIVSDAADRILVIKLGALGDVIQSLGPMRAIRDHHPDAHVTCMTTAPFRDLIAASGTCDDIWIHHRPSNIDLFGWLALRRQLRGGGFRRVYDLQTSSRSNRLFKLIWPGPYPEWSGNAAGCSHPHNNPARDSMHTLARQAEQLADAGISRTPVPSFDGLESDLSGFGLSTDYCLIVPGGAAHRPDKRWPVNHYQELARRIAASGVTPVIVGTSLEAPLAESIVAKVPEVIDLTGKTSLLDLVSLAKSARFAIGNDSGPMHITAVAGVSSVVLYSHASDPGLCAQRGADVTIIRKPSMDDISVEDVLDALPVGNP